MNWLHYLMEANVYLGVFYLCYCLFLNRETHYTLSRAYLLFSCTVAFVLPVTQLSILKPAGQPEFDQPATNVSTIAMMHLAPPPPPEAPPLLTWQDGLFYAYIIGAVVALSVFGFRLFQLYKLAKRDKRRPDNTYCIIDLQDENTAFSFFNYLFIGTNITHSDTIIAHELVHIRQKHSIDIIFLELLKVVSWFNPFIYLLQRSLKTVHEYIADEQTAARENDALTYSSFLLNNAYGIQGSTIAHSFFNYNLLKKRIIMLNKNRSGKLARLKYLAALPLCGAMLCASTLAFSKDYGWIDLTPKVPTAVTTSNNANADTTKKRRLPPPPPAPPITKVAAGVPPPPPPPPFLTEYVKLVNYVAKYTRYPTAAMQNGVMGNILLSLSIDHTKKINNVKVEQGIGSGCDEEAIRVLKAFPGTIATAPGNYKMMITFGLIGSNGPKPNYPKPITRDIAGQSYFIAQVNIHGFPDGLKLPPAPPKSVKYPQAKGTLQAPPAVPPIKAKVPSPPPPAQRTTQLSDSQSDANTEAFLEKIRGNKDLQKIVYFRKNGNLYLTCNGDTDAAKKIAVKYSLMAKRAQAFKIKVLKVVDADQRELARAEI